MLRSHPGSLCPVQLPPGPGMCGDPPGGASRPSESRLLASAAFGALTELQPGSEGLVRLGTNWWDLMGMTGKEQGRNKLPGGQGLNKTHS